MYAYILIVVITGASPYSTGLRSMPPATGNNALPVVSMQRFEDYRACEEAIKYLGQALPKGIGANAACKPVQSPAVTPENPGPGNPATK